MPEISCKHNLLFAIMLIGVMLFQPMLASAKCGGVDYSWGADALSNAHDFTVTMMLYVVYLVYAIAAIVAIIGALQIYNDADWSLPFHDRSNYSVPCILRLQYSIR